MKANPICRVCGIELNDENWYQSHKKNGMYICKKHHRAQTRLWCKANPEKARERSTRSNRKMGRLPFNENKECSQFLGIHIAEQVLSHVFKDVEQMPMNNPGYDFICNHGKKIDIKSSCLRKKGNWLFNIKRNTTANYFLCLAFDDRGNMTPLHAWLIPGSKLNQLIFN